MVLDFLLLFSVSTATVLVQELDISHLKASSGLSPDVILAALHAHCAASEVILKCLSDQISFPLKIF